MLCQVDLNSLHTRYICMFLPPTDFSQSIFSNDSLRRTLRVSRSFNSDQVRRFVGPDLGSKCSKSYQQWVKS